MIADKAHARRITIVLVDDHNLLRESLAALCPQLLDAIG